MSSPIKSKDKKRYHFPDWLRGFAVVLMIIFHLAYDLTYYGFLTINFVSDPFWWWFPRVIVFLFLICVGLSLRMGYVESQTIQWRGFFKRLFELSLFALLISLLTYFLFPQTWIYFGTLHCIALASFLSIPFLRRPLISFGFSLVLLLIFVWSFPFTWPKMKHLSMDYIPLFPWFSIVLLGISFHSLSLHKIPVSQNRFNKTLELLGKKSLIIYLMHQPILFGVIGLISLLIHKN